MMEEYQEYKNTHHWKDEPGEEENPIGLPPPPNSGTGFGFVDSPSRVVFICMSSPHSRLN